MNISGFLNGTGQFFNAIQEQTKARQVKQDEHLESGVKAICDLVSNVSFVNIGHFKVDVTKRKDGIPEGSEPSARSSTLNPSRLERLSSPASSATSSASSASSASAASTNENSLASLSPQKSSHLSKARPGAVWQRGGAGER